MANFRKILQAASKNLKKERNKSIIKLYQKGRSDEEREEKRE